MITEQTRERMIAAVACGDVAIVRRLAPEYRACRTHRSVVAELDSLLRVAIESQLADVVDALIVAGADVGREDGDGQRPLHVAAKTGDVAVLKQLVHAGSLLNAVDRNGSSALYLSAVLGHREASLALIDSGATVNRPRRYDTGEAPIHAIARTGDAVVLDAAMRRAGGRTDLHASNGVTPLHVASREHHSGCVAVLCEGARNDAAVNAPDNSGVTSLHCAVQVAALDCVRILLRHGADANAANREGQTPLHYAAAATHPPSFSHAAVVDLLLAFGAKVCRRDALHRTPLHVAAETGNVSLVSVLLSAGADVNAVERVLGETAVNIAAACGRHSVLHELVAAECDVTIADKHGVTPLHKLLSTGANADAFKYASVDLLLRHGARVNAVDDRGSTPLQACVFHAIISRHSSDGLSVLRRLVSAGALLRSSHHGGATPRSLRNSPLCWLTWHGELTAAAFLVNAGWRLSDEHWIVLPGKTPVMESFLVGVRTVASNPPSLRASCRAALREHLQSVCDDPRPGASRRATAAADTDT